MLQTTKTQNPPTGVNVRKLTILGMMSAIIILMAFTPLGYLKVGVVSITFIMLPVVIGAVVTGPKGGAVLGAVFGITSFVQCFGMDPFGTALASINIAFTFIMCMLPRILMGMLTAYIFKWLQKKDKTNVLSFMIACLSGAIINTIGFVGLLLLFFGSSDYLSQFGDNIIEIFTVLVTFNAIIEAGVCLVFGAAISKVIVYFTDKK